MITNFQPPIRLMINRKWTSVLMFAFVFLIVFVISNNKAYAASCEGVSPSSYTTTNGSVKRYVVYGVKFGKDDPKYVIATVYQGSKSYNTEGAIHDGGGDWYYDVNLKGNLTDAGTYTVGFWPSWQHCTDATYTITQPGTVVVSSNLQNIAYTLQKPPPTNQTFSWRNDGYSHTFNNSDPGTWILSNPDNVSGYDSPTISPSSSQTLTGGGIITFNINYASSVGSITVNTNRPEVAYCINKGKSDGFCWNNSTTSNPYMFLNKKTGTYTLTPDPLSGYSIAVIPSDTQVLNTGQNIQFNVTYTPLQPTAQISCNGSPSTTITYGSSANVSRSSTNAVSCSVSPTGWTGISGSQSTGALFSSQTYTLTCSGN